MRDPKNVIADVVNGHGPDLAVVLEVSKSRCYEILSTDNPYPKTKRLIRAIAQVNPTGIALIKADLDAMFDELLGESTEVPTSHLTRELFEGGQSVLEERSIADQEKELREAIAAASCKLRQLQRDRAVVATAARFSNGRGK